MKIDDARRWLNREGKGKGDDGRSGLPSHVSAIAAPASAVGPPASHFLTLPTGHLHFFPPVAGDWTYA